MTNATDAGAAACGTDGAPSCDAVRWALGLALPAPGAEAVRWAANRVVHAIVFSGQTLAKHCKIYQIFRNFRSDNSNLVNLANLSNFVLQTKSIVKH